MPTPFIYNRKIDQLEEKKAKVYTQKDSPYKGEIFSGSGGIPCLELVNIEKIWNNKSYEIHK